MERKCFDSIVYLDAYEKDGYHYINCICRAKTLVLLPEEEVRQAVLVYLYQHSKIDLRRFLIKVEHNSLDIAFYLNYDHQDFSPSQPPAVIFELKRDFTNLFECTMQLKNYMSRFKCNYGVLTNSSDILFVDELTENRFMKLSISELENRVNDLKFDVEEDIQNFHSAQQGSPEAFVRLINKFGKTSKFTFECKDYAVPITCFFFDVIGNYIFFNFCNVESKRKQPRILKDNFTRLLSINE